ncbi:MAG: hypothetical protein P1P74_12970, partial [Desulfuromonadales bacterium]|nr:hypothetical protein [Desulfuromonadales bacterium]
GGEGLPQFTWRKVTNLAVNSLVFVHHATHALSAAKIPIFPLSVARRPENLFLPRIQSDAI